MRRERIVRRILAPAGETEPERVLALPADKAARWRALLIWFMRVLALAWMAKGLVSWAAILGVGQEGPPFEARSLGHQATVIYFAGVDLIAAVGLWLTSTWGGVLWLLAVMSHLILAVVFPRVVASGLVVIAALIGCILAYLAVSWLAAQGDA